MMVRPWAKAIAAIPLRPAPSPTTAAAPAPINTNAKVPMNSARSLGAREFGIADLQKWACIVLLGATSVAPEDHAGFARRRPGKRQPAGGASGVHSAAIVCGMK